MSPFSELTTRPEWEKLLMAVENCLDTARQQVVTAAEREPVERVRFLAGQRAGVQMVRDYLRGL